MQQTFKGFDQTISSGQEGFKSATLHQQKIVLASAAISGANADEFNMQFLHGILCQVGFPRSKVKARDFLRESGKAWLHIQAGKLDLGDGPIDQPVPYGALPRLAIALISTYAVRHRTVEVPIGNSAADFLRSLNMERAGKRYSALRTQMHALAACRIQLGFSGRTYSGQPIEQFDAWQIDEHKQRSIWPGILRLSQGYYDSLIESAVPLDTRGLLLLKGTALGLDIYVWLAQRLHRLDRDTDLTWPILKNQFGQEYLGPGGLKNFRDEFVRVLRHVVAAYPSANIKVIRGGIQIRRSAPPVPYRR